MKKNSPGSIKMNSGLGSSGDQEITIYNEHYHFEKYKHLAKTHEGGITFNPIALRDVILELASITDRTNLAPPDLKGIDVDKKNKLNGLTQEFYDNIIAIDYEPYFNELDQFLQIRENEDIASQVERIAKSLNKQIFTKRKKFDRFEEFLLAIEDTLIDEQLERLQGKESTVTLFLFYLYTSCLIGKKEKNND